MRGNTQLCPKIEISLENEAKWRLIAEYLRQKSGFWSDGHFKCGQRVRGEGAIHLFAPSLDLILVIDSIWSKMILFGKSYLPFVGPRGAQRQPTTYPKSIIPDASHYQWPNLALSILRRYGDEWRSKANRQVWHNNHV